MFLSNLQLTNDQIAQKELEFQQLTVDPKETEKIYYELRDFFVNANQEDIKKYWYSYWRWYVGLTWDRLNGLSEDELLKVVSKQVPMALLLDIDVWRNLISYFAANNFFADDLESFYLKVKKTFLESQAVIGSWQGKNVIIAELIKEADSVYNSEDSLAKADFESRLQQIMFSGDEMSKKYFTVDPGQIKERFLDVVSFFKVFTEDNIWNLVDAFLNPEKYKGIPPGEAAPASATVSNTPTKPSPATPSSVSAPKQVAPQPAPKTKEIEKAAVPVQPIAKPTTPVKPSLQEVKSQIESQFKKDAEGNFEDIETVLAMLSTLSEKYNDPKISEMLYFDEQENKFKWNV